MRSISLICFAALILVLVTGENTLPLFHNDCDLAARGTAAAVAILGGTAFAFAQPMIWSAFVRKAQKLVRLGGAQGHFAKWILHTNLERKATLIATVLCLCFFIVSVALSVHLWRSGI